MKPLRLKIQQESALKKSPFEIAEKDYALSYVLAGIAKHPRLTHALIFKGGTALKKLFFGDYRFSVDLDFSTINAPKKKSLENALQESIQISTELLSQYGPFELLLKRYPEIKPHPTGQEAFNINVKFPWHRSALCTIKIEITHDEPVILTPEHKLLLHGYDENLDCTIACYPIEEIIAEKLRALLQTHQNLITRGWNRPRARDYYDLWSILKNYNHVIDKNSLIEVLDKKCQHRNVVYSTIDDFFTPQLINEAQQHWKATLGNLVIGLPECGAVLDEARILITNTLR